VRPQVAPALVCDRLLEIGEDLHLIGITRETLLRDLQVGPQCFVAAGIELIGIAVQTDRDDRAHDSCP
jgi:hypothetical protein